MLHIMSSTKGSAKMPFLDNWATTNNVYSQKEWSKNIFKNENIINTT